MHRDWHALPRKGRPSVQSLLRRHRRLQLQSTLVPTRRQRAVSAGVAALPSHWCTRTATAAAPAALDGAMETGESHATVRLPAPPAGTPRARAAALSLPMCAPIRTPRTRNLHPTALWGRLPRRLRLHRSCPPRLPRSSLPRRSGRCLPACRCTRPSHAHAYARPAFDPATAAVRRCQIG